MAIKAVGFDLDDTLYNRNDVYMSVYKEMQQNVLELPIEFETFNTVYQQESIKWYQKFMADQCTEEDYQLQRVITTYDYFGVEIRPADGKLFNELYAYFRKTIQLRPLMKEIIQYLLDQDLELFLLTNGPSKSQWDKIDTLNLEHWFNYDRLFVSGDLNLMKPNSEVFHHLACQMNYDPSEILYIGDHYLNDIKGASDAGWETIYFDCFNKGPVEEELRFHKENQLCDYLKYRFSK